MDPTVTIDIKKKKILILMGIAPKKRKKYKTVLKIIFISKEDAQNLVLIIAR